MAAGNGTSNETGSDFVVFISYAPEDEQLQYTLEQALDRLAGVRVWVDAKIRAGENISSNTEKAINDAECVLSLLTEPAIRSPEVREDLVRADERRIPILVVKEASVDDSHLPHFLRELRYIEYDPKQTSSRELVERVNRAILDLKQKVVGAKLQDASRELTQTAKLLSTKHDIEVFRAEIVSNLIRRTAEEVRDVLGNRYKIDIGLERAFLLRATPLFQNAESVYAVSYDRISTFWKNRNLVSDAKTYLKSHPTRTHRLFVFSTQMETHRFRQILDVHARHYDSDGAVLLCSAESYMKIAEIVIGQPDKISLLLSQDFGVLDFGTRLVEAILSETSLQFSYVDKEAAGLINHQQFIDLMNEFKRLPPGEIHPEYGVIRWEPDFLGNNKRWGDQLKKLFPEPTRDVYHLAFFTSDAVREDGREKIADVRDQLAELDARVRPREIWFGRNRNIDARDKQFGGALKVHDEYQYALLMRLDNVQQLGDYQGVLAHSQIRHKLYSGFDERIKSLFQLMEQLSPTDERRRKIFDVIEDVVSNYMVRMDFVDDADVESILREPWYPF